MSRRLGLIVGVNQYQDSAFCPLQFAENDARALAQWLVNTKGGKWPPPDVQLVQGIHATRELIESMITRLCMQMAGPDDLAVIYFAGHAYIDEQSSDGYLALTNTDHREPRTGLHLPSMIQQVMARSRAAQILCILDCFQSSPAWSRQRAFPTDFRPLFDPSLASALQQGNRVVLCSCRGNELLPETGERGLGKFMYQTVLGLCGPANPAAPDTIELQQLGSYLSTTLGDQHSPQLFGQVLTPFMLVGEMPASPPEFSQMSPVSPSSSQDFPLSPAGNAPYTTGPAASTATAQAAPPLPQRISSDSQQNPAIKRQSQAMISQAQQFIQAKQPGEALSIVEQVLQRFPDETGALVLKGQLLGTLGRTPEALAVVEYLLHLDPQNALAWSMHAVLLTNIGQYPAALNAIERSLELDASNMESYGIKNSIMAGMAGMAAVHTNGRVQLPGRQQSQQPQQNGAATFLLDAGVQFVGFVMGIVGALLLIFLAQLPIAVGLVLESLGLAIMVVSAARGAFRYGASRFVVTLLLCLLAGAILGGTIVLGYKRIIVELAAHPTLLLPVLFLAGWLALAASIPLLVAVISFVAGLIRRRRAR